MLKKILIFAFSLITIIVCAKKDPFEGVRKILIVGNSISRHHIKPSIGWTTHWGMAASAKEKDYVHIIISELDKLYPEAKHEFEIIRLKNEAKMTGVEHLLNKKVDLIIIQHGENYRGQEKNLGKSYEDVIKKLKENVTKNIICVGAWGLNPPRVKKRVSILKKAADNQKVLFVDISDIAKKENSAWADKKFSKASKGVKWHPSDCGMRLIADKILMLSSRLNSHKTACITVNAGKIVAQVNRKVLGQMVSGADGQYIWSSDKSDVNMRRTGWNLWNPQKNTPESIPTELIKALRPGVVRYPGGSAVKNFNWKATVGPYSIRDPNWRWGLMEYLSWCKTINTEPQICLSSYKGTPGDQRDLIEFLNAPAIKKYPWAMKRARYGHKTPYKVKYVELGNEPYDGNRRAKPGKQWTCDGYIDWALKTTKLIREVDPDVKIGLPLWSNLNDNEDNVKILRKVGSKVDYIIHHTYSVMYAGNLSPSSAFADRIARSCMAASEQFEHKLKKFNHDNKKIIGKNLPIGITEYNTSIKSSKPYVYRKSLAAGLFCIDYTFRMMKPENNVLLANYWQIFGGYWGSISYKNRKLGKIWPPYYCFKIVGDHIKDNILAAKVDSPKLTFEGFCAVKPAAGSQYSPAKRLGKINLLKYAKVRVMNKDKNQIQISRNGDLFAIKLKELTKSHYPNFLLVPIEPFSAKFKPSVPGIEYKFSYEAKWTPSSSGRVTLGLGIMDGRGWQKAGSAIGVDGAESARREWKTFSGTYKPLMDTRSLAVLVRIKGGLIPVSGSLQVRNIKIIPWKSETFPAYDALQLMATKSKDGRSLTMLVINKCINKSIPTQINLKNFVSANVANVWTVNGPNASSDSDVKISQEKDVQVKTNSVKYSFPPHSITAIVFKQRKK